LLAIYTEAHVEYGITFLFFLDGSIRSQALPRKLHIAPLRSAGFATLMDGSLVKAFWLLRSACPIRDSFGDSCDVTVKTGTDLAKTRKSQVTFAALNSNKKTFV
jgi:hypothetical protein